MPVTLRSKDRTAAVVLVAKWCVSRGEQVTIAVPTLAEVDVLRPQFTKDELVRITFSMVSEAAGAAVGPARAP